MMVWIFKKLNTKAILCQQSAAAFEVKMTFGRAWMRHCIGIAISMLCKVKSNIGVSICSKKKKKEAVLLNATIATLFLKQGIF